jgi:GTP pyrophosphokinase
VQAVDTLERIQGPLDAWLAGRSPRSQAIPEAAHARLREASVRVGEEARGVVDVLDTLQVDADTLAAAVLYACAPEAPVPEALLGGAVPVLIEGQRAAEKVWSIHAERSARGGSEGLRRLLLAIIRDVRVALILLARQVVRMRLAARGSEDERRRLAELAADIHAPLANRLGIWQLKWELEDLSFRFLNPDTYRRIAALLDEKRGAREGFIEEAKARLRQALAEAGIRGEVAGRPKHIFSIWKKMQRKDVPFSELYDIRAIRVLVDSVADCYAVLGLVHGLWTPVPAEFDDYIANPKGNNYRSLHTAVVGPEGKTLEVQIRTHEMHEHAELGVAAHWRYKEGGGGDAEFERKIAWMRQLLESRDGEDENALLAGLSTELVEDRVYALSPQGEVVDLPQGATALDFAYHVHTEVGHRCRGAKVNGRIVPLTFRPRTGDRVEIMTGKESAPRRDWLVQSNGFLASSRARGKVRAWFNRLDFERNAAEGKELLDRELRRLALLQYELTPVLARFRLARVEDLYVAVALGDLGPHQVARALHESVSGKAAPEPARTPSPAAPSRQAVQHGRGFTIEGVGNLLTQMARCCQPVPGEAIAGYLTRGRGVSIHRQDCQALQRLAASHPERIVAVDWGRQGGSSYSVDILIRAVDRKWLLKDITNLLAESDVHVLATSSRVDERRGQAELRFTLKVSDFAQLGAVLGRLESVPGVASARRLG